MIGRLLGVDHGNKRIGLAISDATGLIAHELQVLHRRTRAEDFTAIARIAAEQRAIGVIVGLPSNHDLPEGVQGHADTVLRWVEELRPATPLPVVLWDEQMTSADAQELARQKRRRWNEPIDDLAA
ncbi:MAG TPA: Holliday junction resolvase RuvX, partial [Candidatus Limnocylindrales bacterium]|nr:Holliday junction resolvase RuvX [Candidatus Limnocylindrales bacterium]